MHPNTTIAKASDSDPYAVCGLTSDQLIDRLKDLVADSNAVTARLLAHLGEVDARKLYLQAAYPSMFKYCVDELSLSEGATYKRLTAARVARRFPAVYRLVQSGQLHLSAVCLLSPRLTPDNAELLLRQAGGRSKRQIEKLLAEWFPSPDVAEVIRRLPKHCCQQASAQAGSVPGRPSAQTGSAELRHRDDVGSSKAPAQAELSSATNARPVDTKEAVDEVHAVGTERVDVVGTEKRLGPGADPGDSAPPTPFAPRQSAFRPFTGEVTPLAPQRYKVQFTASEALRDKLQQAQQLLGHQVPRGDLATVVEKALDALLPVLRKRRFAETAREKAPRPQCTEPLEPRHRSDDAAGPSRHIPAEVKRTVSRRDGHQCTFVDPKTNRRCEERACLEFHHDQPLLPHVPRMRSRVATLPGRAPRHGPGGPGHAAAKTRTTTSACCALRTTATSPSGIMAPR